MNQKIVLVVGKSASGKSASLRNLKDPEGVMYLGCEANKELPFPNKFDTYTITDPYDVHRAFVAAEKGKAHTVIIDTATFLMDIFESVYVLPADDGRAAWGNYAQFFKQLMQQYVANSTKNVYILAHTSDVYNEKELVIETKVKVKGSLMNQGIESYFNTVIAAKKVSIEKLKGYNNPLLHITEEEEAMGLKYVFQTRLTKETVNERIRGPMGLWAANEVFIDNDLQEVTDKLQQYYQ